MRPSWSRRRRANPLQGWSRDLGPRGMTINAVAPGPVDTDMKPHQTDLAEWLKGRVPLGRYGKSEEVAALVSFLVGPEASFITGARMIVDGGLTAQCSLGPTSEQGQPDRSGDTQGSLMCGSRSPDWIEVDTARIL
ncbi:MAG: SDR family oxidoreductase [Pseudomonadota bacterium]